MRIIRAAWGRSLARFRDDEAGFTLVEVTVAITVIFASLVALAYTATIGFSYEDLARQKQTATGIANQMMEQVRGLAWDKITTGHVGTDLGATRSDLTVTNPDSGYLVTGCSGDSAGVYRLFSCAAGSQIGSGEKVVASALSCAPGSPDCVSPLVRHAGQITQNNIVYTWRVYDSNNCPTGTTTGCTAATPYRVTVVVTWTGGKPSPNKIVQVQSLFWSPSGCRSTATHPFAAPCQPFFLGSGRAEEEWWARRRERMGGGAAAPTGRPEQALHLHDLVRRWFPTGPGHDDRDQIRRRCGAASGGARWTVVRVVDAPGVHDVVLGDLPGMPDQWGDAVGRSGGAREGRRDDLLPGPYLGTGRAGEQPVDPRGVAGAPGHEVPGIGVRHGEVGSRGAEIGAHVGGRDLVPGQTPDLFHHLIGDPRRGLLLASQVLVREPDGRGVRQRDQRGEHHGDGHGDLDQREARLIVTEARQIPTTERADNLHLSGVSECRV